MRRIPLNIAKLFWAWPAVIYLWMALGLVIFNSFGPLSGTIFLSWADAGWSILWTAVGAGIAILSYPDVKIEKIEIRDNVLQGPNSPSVSFKMSRINLQQAFIVNKSYLFMPFTTLYYKQGKDSLCLSTMFLSSSELAEIVENIETTAADLSRTTVVTPSRSG